MMRHTHWTSIVLIAIGVAAVTPWHSSRRGDAAAPTDAAVGKEASKTGTPPGTNADPRELRAEIERLKTLLPDQSHAMADVAAHFSNLWFAGQADNWPLADFYASETRAHLQWAVRIKPIRKDNAGQEIELEKILAALENSPLKQLKEAIAAKNHDRFVAAYRFTLEGCYSCHKASDKPYLRVQIPQRPENPIVNFDPNAQWPK